MKNSLLFRLAVLVTAMMCALGASAQEPYACYTADNTTLSFYYDDQRSSRTGTTYDMNLPNNDPGWAVDGTKENVTNVMFDPSFEGARPTSTYLWFYDMQNLESITGMSYLNTSEVTDMAWMFFNCQKLTSIDVTHFNTAKVTTMANMFYDCNGLTDLDLSSFNTSSVTDMMAMFSLCGNLRTIYVGNDWSTAAVTKSNLMFYECFSLVGGQGTTYDANYVNKVYAHIDGGTSNPGYLTGPETYACYTPSNTTLTFYYDNHRSSRQGTTYDMNTSNGWPGWETDGTNANVTSVVFDPSFEGARPTTSYHWFYGMSNLESITGMNYLNTSKVTNMGHMFAYCEKLTNVDLSHFNTSWVFSFYYMFNGCSSLTSLDLSSFNTPGVNNMEGMFFSCGNLRTIYVGDGWNTAAVTRSDYMFHNCDRLVGGQGTTFDANHVDASYAHIDGGTSNPGYFTAAGEQPWVLTEAYAVYTADNTALTFYYDDQRYSRTGTSYNLNKGTNYPGWYTDGTNANVTQVVFDPSFAGVHLKTTFFWFNNMWRLQTITGIGYLNTNEVTDMTYMFAHCRQLTSLDLSTFNTSNVTDMSYMFLNCTDLQTIYVSSGWTTAAVTNSERMFEDCTRLVGGQGTTYDENHVGVEYAHIDGGPSNPGYFTEKCAPEPYACYTADNTTLTFYCDDQRSSRTGTTYDMNMPNHDPGWATDGTKENVTNVVFDPSFEGARPTSTYSWFYDMKNLESITGMSYLNTSEVADMAWMFFNCQKLTSIDVTRFNTAKVTTMAYMFYGCNGLTDLDMSSFNTSSVTDMMAMFFRCGNLRTIYVGNDWSTAAVTKSDFMFYECFSLVGGQGTTYDANYVNKAYAHIDGGTSNPGYFTEKPAFLRGDVDNNGEVTIADVTALIDYLLSGDGTGINLDAAYCNSDSDVTIADVTALIDYLLGGTWN